MLFALLVALAAFCARNLTVDSNIVNLLPADSPATQALQALDESEGGLATLVITVRGGTIEDRHAWLGDLAGRLEGLPEVRYTFHQMDPALAWRAGLFHLEPAELAAIRNRLRGAVALGPAMTNPFVAGRLMDLGPLTEKLRKAGFYARLNPSEDTSRLLVRPTRPPLDLPFARSLMAKVYQAIEEGRPEDHGLEVLWVGGAYRHSVEDYEGIVRDIEVTSLLAFSVVFLVVSVAFRRARSVLVVLTPNLVGAAWTLGFAGCVVPALNTFTSFFNAVVVGLGIGFAIHLYARFREERLHTDTLEAAIIRAWDRVGLPCFSAAATTSVAFWSLFLARFRGFRELGLLAGGGVLLTLAASFLVLPLLLVWLEQKPVPMPARYSRPGGGDRTSLYRWAPLGLAGVLAATLGAAALVPGLGFQYDISELRREGMAWSDMDHSRRQMVRDAYAPLVASYPDDASLRAAHVAVQADIREGRLPEIAQAFSVYSVIAPDQEEKLALLEEIAALARHENARYLPPAVRENLAPLLSGPVCPITRDDLSPALQDLLGAAGGQHRLLLMAADNIWDLAKSAHLYDVVLKRFPDVPVAGEYLAMGSLYQIMRADWPRISLLALVLVTLLTFVDLKKPIHSLAATGTLVAGMAWAGAMAVMLGIKLSIVNVMGLAMVVGVGIDLVLHLFHRIRQEGPGSIGKALTTTGWAASLSTITNMSAFGVLMAADSRGVASLGKLVAVGLASCTLATFLLLPLGFAAAWRRRVGAPRA
ncbi:MAG: MMPL family transporter [Deltaproteobacteria bacterium]|nr:MMPL family transporter [Deltaproteobacteria bacterium]